MNIKGLILGSAALAVASTGAQAADVIFADPEPTNPVLICDMYGVGFFYIPGTETCLRVSGYVWYQISTSSSQEITDTPAYYPAPDRFRSSTRARLNFDARSDTEWGTLRGYVRVQADWEAVGVANDGNAVIDQAFLELGGLRMGYTESAWVTSQGAGVAQFGSHSWGGMYYGYQQRQLVSYTFQGGNGFHATLSLEADTVFGSTNAGAGFAGRGYVPDIVGVVGVNQGWGGVWAKVGFDESINATQSGWGAQVGVQINVPNAPGSNLRVIGYYADGDTQFGPGSPWSAFGGGGLAGQPEWSILASYHHQFTDTFGLSVAAQYFDDVYLYATDVNTGLDGWAFEVSAVWTPITNFEVRAEYHYDKVDFLDGSHSGFLRFTRSF